MVKQGSFVLNDNTNGEAKRFTLTASSCDICVFCRPDILITLQGRSDEQDHGHMSTHSTSHEGRP